MPKSHRSAHSLHFIHILGICVALCTMLAALPLTAAESGDTAWLVKDGQPKAQIVTAGDPPRLVKLAAEELQHYIQKIGRRSQVSPRAIQ